MSVRKYISLKTRSRNQSYRNQSPDSHCKLIDWFFHGTSLYRKVFRKVVIPVRTLLLKVNNRNSRKRCKIRSRLTIKAPEQHHSRCFGVCVVNTKLWVNNIDTRTMSILFACIQSQKSPMTGKYIFSHVYLDY